jgi:hypothetical protein
MMRRIQIMPSTIFFVIHIAFYYTHSATSKQNTVYHTISVLFFKIITTCLSWPGNERMSRHYWVEYVSRRIHIPKGDIFSFILYVNLPSLVWRFNWKLLIVCTDSGNGYKVCQHRTSTLIKITVRLSLQSKIENIWHL